MKQGSGPGKAPAEQVLKDIRRQTRRHYSAEERSALCWKGCAVRRTSPSFADAEPERDDACCLSGTKAAQERGLMVLESVVFAAGIVVIACAIIGGLYLLCRHAAQSEETKPGKKLPMSDYK